MNKNFFPLYSIFFIIMFIFVLFFFLNMYFILQFFFAPTQGPSILLTTTSLLFPVDAIKNVIDIDGDGVESNWEFFIAMDPNNMYGNDYVWDHFDWDHCS